MITAILDTNVLLQAAIGRAQGASCRVLRASKEGKYTLVFSPTTLEELFDVLMVPRLRKLHGWSDDQILEFTSSFFVDAAIFPGEKIVSPSLTRDPSDTKFLALAEESKANFLVTKDRRHLLGLKRYNETWIVSPSQVLRELQRGRK